MLTLVEALALLEKVDPDDDRFAVMAHGDVWVCFSEARLVHYGEDCELPEDLVAAGYRVVVSRVDLELVTRWAAEKDLSPEVFAELVIHWSRADAFPVWFDYMPNRARQRPSPGAALLKWARGKK